ncbi:MAG: hypothetical protein KDD36_10655 [Flavobacteriales bacterium]|nr:hypothetical protein [Flavobacteriales bacterium]
MRDRKPILFVPCKTATGLMEKRKEMGLTTLEKIQLRMHTIICKFCRAYKIQSDRLDMLLGNLLRKPEGEQPSEKLSDDEKKHLLSQLRLEEE